MDINQQVQIVLYQKYGVIHSITLETGINLSVYCRRYIKKEF